MKCPDKITELRQKELELDFLVDELDMFEEERLEIILDLFKKQTIVMDEQK